MSYKVTLRPSGATFDVAKGQSVTTAAIEAGVPIAYSCRRGTCQTCVGRVVEGAIDEKAGYMPEDIVSRGMVLLCQATPLSDLVVEAQEAPSVAAPRTTKIMVYAMERAASDVMILTMRLPIARPFEYRPGQYIELHMPDGGRRCYSIANPPVPGGTLDLTLHVRDVPGGRFTKHVFNGMRAREVLWFTGPLGAFTLRDMSDKPIIFLASGTGYGPIRSIILDAFARGETRPMTLYWGARGLADLYLIDEVEELVRHHAGLRFVPVLSEPRSEDRWSGRTGLVHEAVMADLPDLSGYQVYACGAPAMVSAARDDFPRCGLSPDDFFADSFLTEADMVTHEVTSSVA